MSRQHKGTSKNWSEDKKKRYNLYIYIYFNRFSRKLQTDVFVRFSSFQWYPNAPRVTEATSAWQHDNLCTPGRPKPLNINNVCMLKKCHSYWILKERKKIHSNSCIYKKYLKKHQLLECGFAKGYPASSEWMLNAYICILFSNIDYKKRVMSDDPHWCCATLLCNLHNLH